MDTQRVLRNTSTITAQYMGWDFTSLLTVKRNLFSVLLKLTQYFFSDFFFSVSRKISVGRRGKRGEENQVNIFYEEMGHLTPDINH